MTRNICVSCLAVFLILGACQASGDDKLLYFSGKTEVPLVEDRDFGLLPLRGEEESALDKRISPNTLVEINLPYLEKETGLRLVRRRDVISVDSFSDLIILAQGAESDSKRKVFKAQGATVVLTNSFTIQLSEKLPKDKVEDMIGGYVDFKYKIDSDDLRYEGKVVARRPFRWRVTIADETTPEQGLQQINRLCDSALVEEVIPDLIFLSVDALNDLRLWLSMMDRLNAQIDPSTWLCPAGSAGAPNDDFFEYQWHLQNKGDHPNFPVNDEVDANGDPVNPDKFHGTPGADIDAIEAWGISKASDEVAIAVLDVGIDSKHPDLDNILILPGIDATDPDNPHPEPLTEDAAHGTNVAGLAAAETNNFCRGVAGVGWGARILSIRIADDPEGHNVGSVGITAVIDGIAHARERKALGEAKDVDILLMAWHLVASSNTFLEDEIRKAIEEGIVVVISSGNYYLTQSEGVKYPASLAAGGDQTIEDGLIVVGATTQTDLIKKAYSAAPWDPNGGPDSWGSRHGDAVSLSAPGLFMSTTDHTGKHTGGPSDLPYVQDWDGTSAAAPLVAGAAAILLTCYPDATPAQVKRWLQEGAEPGPTQQQDANGNFTWDEFYGLGRLSITGALDAAKQEMETISLPGASGMSSC